MDLKTFLLFAGLLYILQSQIASTAVSRSFTVLKACVSYVCESEYNACSKDPKCPSLMSSCEPSSRYPDQWSNWVNCTAGNALAQSLVKCRYSFLCRVNYQKAYGVDNLTAYLNDSTISHNVKVISEVPYGWINSTNYRFDSDCVAQICQAQSLYCLLNTDCSFFWQTCVSSS